MCDMGDLGAIFYDQGECRRYTPPEDEETEHFNAITYNTYRVTRLHTLTRLYHEFSPYNFVLIGVLVSPRLPVQVYAQVYELNWS